MKGGPIKPKRHKVSATEGSADTELVEDLLLENAAMEVRNAAMEVQIAELQKKLKDQQEIAELERRLIGLTTTTTTTTNTTTNTTNTTTTEIGKKAENDPVHFRASWEKFPNHSLSSSPASSRSQSPESVQIEFELMQMFLTDR